MKEENRMMQDEMMNEEEIIGKEIEKRVGKYSGKKY